MKVHSSARDRWQQYSFSKRKIWGSSSGRQLYTGCVTGRIRSKNRRKDAIRGGLPSQSTEERWAAAQRRQMGKIWGALIEGVIIQKCKLFLLRFCFIRKNKLDWSRIMYESLNVHRYMNRCREKATKVVSCHTFLLYYYAVPLYLTLPLIIYGEKCMRAFKRLTFN